MEPKNKLLNEQTLHNEKRKGVEEFKSITLVLEEMDELEDLKMEKEYGNSNSNRTVKVTLLAIAFIFFVSAIPLFIISIYSRPCADDYAYAVSTYQLIQSGNWNIVDLIKTAVKVDWEYYNTWQGLYTSAFILALHPGIFGEQYYFVGAIMLLLIGYLSVYMCIRSVEKILHCNIHLIWLTFMIMAVFLQGLPSLTEGIYWFNGAWNYTFFFFLVLTNVAVILKFWRSEAKRECCWL